MAFPFLFLFFLSPPPKLFPSSTFSFVISSKFGRTKKKPWFGLRKRWAEQNQFYSIQKNSFSPLFVILPTYASQSILKKLLLLFFQPFRLLERNFPATSIFYSFPWEICLFIWSSEYFFFIDYNRNFLIVIEIDKNKSEENEKESEIGGGVNWGWGQKKPPGWVGKKSTWSFCGRLQHKCGTSRRFVWVSNRLCCIYSSIEWLC